MSSDYTYNPDTWHPVLAGVVAGAIAAIVAGVLAALLRSPDEVVANSLTVVLGALVLGGISGLLWRRIRVNPHAIRTFGLTLGGGYFVAMLAVTIVDQTVLSNLIAYAVPLGAVIFITLGFMTPLLAGVTAPVWVAAIPVLIALAIGVGLFGRGNVASGELTLDSVTTTTAVSTVSADAAADTGSDTGTDTTQTTVAVDTSASEGGLSGSYVMAAGVATYSVEESLRGLATQGVGTTESIAGSIAPGAAFAFEIDLLSFESDSDRRDSRVREWFAAHPVGTFTGESFDMPEDATPGEVYALAVGGAMTINDIAMDISWDVEARLEDSGAVTVTGETFIVLSDFDIPVVTGGFVEMEDGATIEVAFVAEPAS
ncbi:MAG: YceI family protein [Acidimicrobiia bacterium]